MNGFGALQHLQAIAGRDSPFPHVIPWPFCVPHSVAAGLRMEADLRGTRN